MNKYYWKIKIFLEDCYYEVKWFIQTIFRGYSDRDLWSIDTYIARKMVKMLPHLKRVKHGYPIGLTEKQWDKIMDKMIRAFEIIVDDYSPPDEITSAWMNTTNMSVGSLFEPKEGMKKESERAYKRYRKEVEKLQKEADEGLDLFREYFHNLWD